MTIKLNEALREVARRFDNPKSSNEDFDAGICFAVQRAGLSNAYGQVDALLWQAQQDWDGFVLADYPGRQGWQDRAFMCLLLAHWLEDLE